METPARHCMSVVGEAFAGIRVRDAQGRGTQLFECFLELIEKKRQPPLMVFLAQGTATAFWGGRDG